MLALGERLLESLALFVVVCADASLFSIRYRECRCRDASRLALRVSVSVEIAVLFSRSTMQSPSAW